MTEKMEFTVQTEPDGRQYIITATVDGETAAVHCDCLAGKTGQICKHRRALLEGDKSLVVIESSHTPEYLRRFIADTALGRAIDRLRYSEELLARAQKLNSDEKARLARLMNADESEMADL